MRRSLLESQEKQVHTYRMYVCMETYILTKTNIVFDIVYGQYVLYAYIFVMHYVFTLPDNHTLLSFFLTYCILDRTLALKCPLFNFVMFIIMKTKTFLLDLILQQTEIAVFHSSTSG